ncbi:MAG: protein kinase [Polyangiaceae bacterium]
MSSLGTYGRYQLLDLLGRGSITEVFKAKSFGVEGFEKTLVIKRVLPELSAEADFVGRFVREAQLSVRLSHSGVVQVFDLGRVDEAVGTSFFMATELVQGLDLRRLLERLDRAGRAVPVGLALFIVSELAKALDHAHRRRDERGTPLGIVHGDLNPGNVLLSWEGEVKLSDFGIGRAFYSLGERAPEELLNQKLGYTSPEQICGNDIDARSDLFSLGTLAYRLLTGKHPFMGARPTQTTSRILGEKPLQPAELRSDLAPSLSALVMQLLEQDPAKRGESAARVYEQLLEELYAAGARQGARDLSELIEELDDAPSSPELPSEPRLELPSESRIVSARVSGSDAPPSSGRFQGVAQVLDTTPEPAVASARPLADLAGREVSALVVRFPRGSTTEETSERAREVVERYGARVLSFGVDELVALFGLEEADGRDTELAVRSGLVLLRSLGASDVEPGVGIHAGRIAAAANVDVNAGDVSALLGQARELCTTLEGSLIISDAAAKNVGRLFSLESAPGAGRTAARAWIVGEPRSPREAYGRFVGRLDELKRLGGVLARASRRHLQVVGIVGEHGIGKSRLVYEMERRIQRGEFNIRCHLAECVPSGKSLPYSAIVAMLRSLCGVREGDSPERIAAVEPRLRALGLHDEEVEIVLTELGLTRGDRAASAGVLKNAVAGMLDGLAKDQLHVFSWDNAQDIDAPSVELLSRVAERLERARLILLFAARSGEAAHFRELPGYQEVQLGTLDEDDVYRLVCVRLGVREVPEALFQFVHERCAGHPMFVEELLREAQEAGAIVVEDKQITRLDLGGVLSVPRPLRSLLGDRIRRLEDPERDLMIATAIVTSPADTSVLSAMLDCSLGHLNSLAERLEASKLMLRDGPVALSFPSPLLAEVIVASLEDEQLIELHHSAANAYQMILGDRTEQEAGRIAYHLAAAGELDRAAGFYATSGMYQLNARRLEYAVGDLARALDLADWDARGGEQLAEWVRALSRAIRHVRSGEGLSELVLRLAARLEQDSAMTPGLRLGAGVDLALSLGALHRYKEARQLLSRAAQLAQHTSLSSAEQRALFAAEAEVCFHQGDFRAAMESIERAKQLAAGDAFERHRMELSSAQALAGAGELDAAQQALDAASAILPAEDDPVLLCERAKVRALIRAFQRDWGGSALAAEQAAELGREAGLSHEVAVNLHNQGDSLMRLGELPRAYAALQKSLEVAEVIGSDRMVNLNRIMLAYLDAANGSNVARRVLGERLAAAEAQRWTWDAITGRYLLGKLLSEQGDVLGARRELTLARRLAEDSKNRLLSEDCRMQLEALEARSAG